MDQEKQKDVSARAAQNIVPIGLLLVEVVLVFTEAVWAYPLVGFSILVGGALSGLYFILEREVKDGRIKRPHLSSAGSLVCWAWFAVAVLLLEVNPGIYGFDLDALMPIIINVGGSAALGVIFTITALLITARKR